MAELQKPQIEIYWTGTLVQPALLQYLAEGIEEEGVPCHMVAQTTQLDAIKLSAQAALDSSLEVGIGWDAQGDIAIHHRRLPDDAPLFQAHWPYQPETLRLLGSHAARLVKGLPFKLATSLGVGYRL